MIACTQGRWRSGPHIADFVDLAALHERRLIEGRVHGFPQRLRPVEDHQQAPVGAQAATLQVGDQALTDRGILGRSFPEPERLFLPVRSDPERDDQTVVTDMDAIQDQPDQIQVFQGRRAPRPRAAPPSSPRTVD